MKSALFVCYLLVLGYQEKVHSIPLRLKDWSWSVWGKDMRRAQDEGKSYCWSMFFLYAT